MMRLLAALVWIGFGSLSWGQVATLTKTQEPKPVQVGGGITQYVGFHSNVRPTTILYASGDYTFSETSTFRVYQQALKSYSIAEIGGREIDLSDTSLYYLHSFKPTWEGLKFGVRIGTTVPISYVSRHRGIVTKPNLRVSVSRKFLKDALSVSYRPFVQYYVNSFTSSPGGTPNPKIQVGHSLLATYSPLKKWSVTALAMGAFEWKETVVQNSPSRQGGIYMFDVSANYQATEMISASLGYLQTDGFIQEGRYEINVFDELNSKFYLNLAFSY